MTVSVVELSGGCHCGVVRFAITIAQKVHILDCNCSICSKTGFQHLIVSHRDFELLCGRDYLASYRFGSGAAEHLFCRQCGIKSFYQPRSHPESWSVNLRCLDDVALLDIEITRFDGQNWEQAISRLP